MPPRYLFGFLSLAWFYRGARATALGRAFSHFWAAWAGLGLPPWRQMGLELPGRKTGQPRRIAVVIVHYAGQRFLVSMLGECEWVRNARVSGRATLIGWRRCPVRLEEVPAAARGAIIQAYLRVAPGARPHIGLDASADLVACQAVAPHHPVFRII